MAINDINQSHLLNKSLGATKVASTFVNDFSAIEINDLNETDIDNGCGNGRLDDGESSSSVGGFVSMGNHHE